MESPGWWWVWFLNVASLIFCLLSLYGICSILIFVHLAIFTLRRFLVVLVLHDLDVCTLMVHFYGTGTLSGYYHQQFIILRTL